MIIDIDSQWISYLKLRIGRVLDCQYCASDCCKFLGGMKYPTTGPLILRGCERKFVTTDVDIGGQANFSGMCCPFLDVADNKCKIHSSHERFLSCMLHPFFLWHDELAVNIKCSELQHLLSSFLKNPELFKEIKDLLLEKKSLTTFNDMKFVLLMRC